MTKQLPPGPKGLRPILDFAKDPPEYLAGLNRTYGDVTYFRLGLDRVYFLTNPDDIREVLVTKASKFEKGDLDRKILGKFLGNGLLTSEGTFHKRQRRLAQPAFHTNRIQAYADVMVAYTEQLLTQWQPGQVRDIDDDMMRLTMFIVAKTLFDADVSDTAEKVGHAIQVFQDVSNAEYRRGFSTPGWIPTPNNRKRKQAVTVMNETIHSIIAERRAAAQDGVVEDTGDLLSMLLLAQDEDGSQMTDQQVRDEVTTLFAAGHETTSHAMTWTWYLLSQYPDVEAKLHQELDTVLAGRTPTLADLRQLPYAQMVIKESMRLYPPAWILGGRVALADVTIGEYDIPAGSLIFISPYVMHRLPQYFPQPERFDPERFTPENEAQLPKYVYIPFGAGSRVCIGYSFALMEAHLILATMAQRFRLSFVPNQEVVPNALITLSPQNGLRMRVEARQPVSVNGRVPEVKTAVLAVV